MDAEHVRQLARFFGFSYRWCRQKAARGSQKVGWRTQITHEDTAAQISQLRLDFASGGQAAARSSGTHSSAHGRPPAEHPDRRTFERNVARLDLMLDKMVRITELRPLVHSWLATHVEGLDMDKVHIKGPAKGNRFGIVFDEKCGHFARAQDAADASHGALFDEVRKAWDKMHITGSSGEISGSLFKSQSSAEQLKRRLTKAIVAELQTAYQDFADLEPFPKDGRIFNDDALLCQIRIQQEDGKARLMWSPHVEFPEGHEDKFRDLVVSCRKRWQL